MGLAVLLGAAGCGDCAPAVRVVAQLEMLRAEVAARRGQARAELIDFVAAAVVGRAGQAGAEVAAR